MATDFSKKTTVSAPLSVGSKKDNNLPLDIRTRIETIDEIEKIEFPYIGMLFYVVDEDKYYSVKTLKSEELIPGIASTAINNYRIGSYEEFEADSSVEEDILISGVDSVGALIEGQVIPAGTTFTSFLKMLLQKPEHAEYFKPTILMEATPTEKQQEVGTKISPRLAFSYKQNDGGEITEVKFGPINGVQQAETSILDGENMDYTVTVSYAMGKQKYDDFGKPLGTPLPEGQVSASCCYEGFRYIFFGADHIGELCESSEEIRQLEKTREHEFTVKVAPGSRRVMIAVPVNEYQPVSIDYEEQGNAEYKSNFKSHVVKVSGATPGEDMMDYNVYTFLFLVPCVAEMTFNVRLG